MAKENLERRRESLEHYLQKLLNRFNVFDFFDLSFFQNELI